MRRLAVTLATAALVLSSGASVGHAATSGPVIREAEKPVLLCGLFPWVSECDQYR